MEALDGGLLPLVLRGPGLRHHLEHLRGLLELLVGRVLDGRVERGDAGEDRAAELQLVGGVGGVREELPLLLRGLAYRLEAVHLHDDAEGLVEGDAQGIALVLEDLRVDYDPRAAGVLRSFRNRCFGNRGFGAGVAAQGVLADAALRLAGDVRLALPVAGEVGVARVPGIVGAPGERGMRGQLAQVVHVQPVFSVFLVVERADQAVPQLRVVLRQEERPDVVVVAVVCLVGAPVLRDETRRHSDLAAVVALPFALRVREFVHPRLERPALLVGQDGAVPFVERYPRALDVLRVDQPAALRLRVPPVGAPGPLGSLAAKGVLANFAPLRPLGVARVMVPLRPEFPVLHALEYSEMLVGLAKPGFGVPSGVQPRHAVVIGVYRWYHRPASGLRIGLRVLAVGVQIHRYGRGEPVSLESERVVFLVSVEAREPRTPGMRQRTFLQQALPRMGLQPLGGCARVGEVALGIRGVGDSLVDEVYRGGLGGQGFLVVLVFIPSLEFPALRLARSGARARVVSPGVRARVASLGVLSYRFLRRVYV